MIPELLTATAAALGALAAPDKGSVEVHGDPESVHRALSNTPSHWRLLLLWSGESANDAAARNVSLAVILQASRGLAADGGEAARTRLLALKEMVHGWLAAMRYQTADALPFPRIDCHGWVFTDSAWLESPEYPGLQIRSSFSLPCACPFHDNIIPVTLHHHGSSNDV